MRNFASEKTRSLFSFALSSPRQAFRSGDVEKSRGRIRESWEAVRELQGSLRKALVDGDRVECDDCPELKALVDEVEAFAKAKYPKASKKVRECVSRKIPKLIDEGKPQDQAIAIAFSMCGGSEESAEKAVDTSWMSGPEPEAAGEDEPLPVEEDKALGDEAADQDDLRMREAAEAAEAGADVDDFTEQAIDIVAQAIMRAKKGQKLKMTPEQKTARAKKAWETRKKNQQAKAEAEAAGKPSSPVEEPAPTSAAPAPAEEPSAPAPGPAEEPAPAPGPAEEPATSAAPAEEPVAPAGSMGDAQSKTSAAGDLVSAGDLAGAAAAADEMIQAITAARDEAQQGGNAEAAEDLSDLLDQIGGVPGGLKNLAAQGGVDETTQGQIKQTFDQIGARLGELSGADAEPVEAPAAEAPAAPPSEPPAPEAEPEAPPEPVAPSEPAPTAPPAPEPEPEPAAEAPPAPPEEAPPAPAEAPAEPTQAPEAGEAQPKPGGWKRAKVSPESTAKVQNIMARNDFTNESEEMEELAHFKGTLGQRGRGRTIDQLKRDFIENMNPSNYDTSDAFQKAKQRMEATPAQDFAMILAAIHEDEDEVGAAAPAAAAAPAVGAGESGPAPVMSSLDASRDHRRDAALLVRGALDRVLGAVRG